MSLFTLFQHSVFYGLLLSLGMSVLIIGALRYNPELMLRSYPPDIKAKYGPARPETTRQRKFLMLPLLALLIVVFGSAVAQLQPLTFTNAFLCAFLVLMTFNLYDLIVLDWLMFGLFLPKWAILPGTEGMAGYSDYSFAFKGFLKGCVISVMMGVIVASIAWGVTSLI